MVQYAVIGVVFIGLIGGGYYVLNPQTVYEVPEGANTTEIVIDDGESTLMKKFPLDVEEREIILEEQTIRIDVPTSTPKKKEEEEATTTEEVVEIEPDEPVDPNRTLALGDGKISTEPESGSVYSCDVVFNENAKDLGLPWVLNNEWLPEQRVSVSGNVNRTNAKVTFKTDGDVRIVSGNGLPKNKTGAFPISPKDPAFEYDKKSATIEVNTINLMLPRNPEIATNASCIPRDFIGVTVTGATLYSAVDKEGRDARAHEILDACGGHPGKTGQYHYHHASECLIDYAESKSEDTRPILVGYALDGFGIFANKENGEVVTNSDLDECHGHSHKVMWDGKMKDIYHYHATDEYPYTLGCFKGTPIEL